MTLTVQIRLATACLERALQLVAKLPRPIREHPWGPRAELRRAEARGRKMVKAGQMAALESACLGR